MTSKETLAARNRMFAAQRAQQKAKRQRNNAKRNEPVVYAEAVQPAVSSQMNFMGAGIAQSRRLRLGRKNPTTLLHSAIKYIREANWQLRNAGRPKRARKIIVTQSEIREIRGRSRKTNRQLKQILLSVCE